MSALNVTHISGRGFVYYPMFLDQLYASSIKRREAKSDRLMLVRTMLWLG